MNEKNAKDILVDAKNYINLNGWYQGDYWNGALAPLQKDAVAMSLPVCSLGGFVFAAEINVKQVAFGGVNLPPGPQRAFEALEAAVRSDRHSHHIHVPEWNDEEGRTKQEVLDMFDRAIESLDTDSSD